MERERTKLGESLEMELAEFRQARAVLTAELRKRAEHVGLGCSYTRRYLAIEDGQEVGFVALDYYPPAEPIWLYDILVPRQLRKRGVGTRILRAVESLALSAGYRSVNLYAKPLDCGMSTSDLVAWYQRNGYQIVKHGDKPQLQKFLK